MTKKVYAMRFDESKINALFKAHDCSTFGALVCSMIGQNEMLQKTATDPDGTMAEMHAELKMLKERLQRIAKFAVKDL